MNFHSKTIIQVFKTTPSYISENQAIQQIFSDYRIGSIAVSQ